MPRDTRGENRPSKIVLERYSQRSLNEWGEDLFKLYGEVDAIRPYSTTWLTVAESGSKIAEDIRKDDYHTLIENLMHAFVWIISSMMKSLKENKEDQIIFKYEDTPADIIALKYPGICGTCHKCECVCSLHVRSIGEIKNKTSNYEKLLDKREEFKSIRPGYRDLYINEWVDMFKRIYGEPITATPIEHIAFHFMEEVGEAAYVIRKLEEVLRIWEIPEKNEILKEIGKLSSVTKCFEVYISEPRSKDKVATLLRYIANWKLTLAIELGDCISWWAALFIKVKQIYEGTMDFVRELTPETKVEEMSKIIPEYFILRKYYDEENDGLICWKCLQNKCRCYSNTNQLIENCRTG